MKRKSKPRRSRPITNNNQPTTTHNQMKKVPVGRKIRISGNSNEHNYTIGGIYTVTHIDDSDGTLKAEDANGVTGNWIRWKDVTPAGTVGWDFIKKVLPADVIEFLGAFDGIEQLELSGDVKDAILLSLPDLHERILKETTKIQSAAKGEPNEQDVGNDADDIFG
jgi:hypothetical protein